MVDIMDPPATNLKGFCFSCTDLPSWTAPIGVIPLTNVLCYQFNVSNQPKGSQQGPTTTNKCQQCRTHSRDHIQCLSCPQSQNKVPSVCALCWCSLPKVLVCAGEVLLLCVFGVSYMIGICCVLVLSDPAKDLCGFCVKPFYGWGFGVNLLWKIDSL